MNLTRLTYRPSDPWDWRLARLSDLADIVNLTEINYTTDAEDIFTTNPTRLQYHVTQAIIKQIYNSRQLLLSVARRRLDDRLVAWTWLDRGKYTVYADEEMAEPQMLHVDLTLPAATRMRLTYQILEQWIGWCALQHIPVLFSNTVRKDSGAFMRLHESLGFEIYGSIAYKRILGEV